MGHTAIKSTCKLMIVDPISKDEYTSGHPNHPAKPVYKNNNFMINTNDKRRVSIINLRLIVNASHYVLDPYSSVHAMVTWCGYDYGFAPAMPEGMDMQQVVAHADFNLSVPTYTVTPHPTKGVMCSVIPASNLFPGAPAYVSALVINTRKAFSTGDILGTLIAHIDVDGVSVSSSPVNLVAMHNSI